MSDPTSEAKDTQGWMEYRLISTGLIHSPGLCASLRHQFKTGTPSEALWALKAFASAYPAVPIGLVWDYFSVNDVNIDLVSKLEDEGETLVLTDRDRPIT